MPNIDLKKLLGDFQGEHSKGIKLLKQVIAMFDKSSVTGAEKKTQAKFAQSAVSRGLAGSTVAPAVSAGISKEFEDIRVGRLSEAMNQLAQFFASPGTIAHTATGGFGGQMALEQQRFEQERANFPSVYSGNQQGLGYQPPTNFGSNSNFSGGPSGGSLRRGNISGTVSDSGSTWGNTSSAISKEQGRNKPAPTFAGMQANYGISGETTLGPEIPWNLTTPDWAEEAAAEEAYQGGWTG